MQRVLFVLSWQPTVAGGVSTVVTNLHDYLRTCKNWGARVLVDSWPDRKLRTENIAGREIAFVRIRWPYVRGRAFRAALAFAMTFLPTALRCRRYLQKNQISLVNIHFPGGEAMVWLLMRRLRLFRGAVVLSFHGTDVTRVRAAGSALERFMWRFMVQSATAVTACSGRLSAELLAVFPTAAGKIHVVPNGIDVDQIAAESRTHSAQGMSDKLISITGFEFVKGLDVLLRAFARLRVSHPDIGLKLLCRDGPESGKAKALIAELGLADSVSLEVNCPHDRAMSQLAQARALVLPSRKEAFGIVILEAAALVRPVILTDTCGILDSLDPSLVTVVVADDVAALASGMESVLSDEHAARLRALRLHALLRGTFGWSHAALLLLRAAGRLSAGEELA
jgi:glycosyltransferase involved in cell wall biosynthesis